MWKRNPMLLSMLHLYKGVNNLLFIYVFNYKKRHLCVESDTQCLIHKSSEISCQKISFLIYLITIKNKLNYTQQTILLFLFIILIYVLRLTTFFFGASTL